jgi:hypothetical protein
MVKNVMNILYENTAAQILIIPLKGVNKRGTFFQHSSLVNGEVFAARKKFKLTLQKGKEKVCCNSLIPFLFSRYLRSAYLENLSTIIK